MSTALSKEVLLKIRSQTDRINRFLSGARAKLEAEDVTPLSPDGAVLPESEVTDRVLNEQDNLLEDVLIIISVIIRILSEIFPSKLKSHKISVYDYEDKKVSEIELSGIADLLLHNRYLVIMGNQVVDLLSDKKFMSRNPQMGLRIDFYEYLSEVEGAINGLTVDDLLGKLWGITKYLSTSSSIKDIIFLTQNLYALGDSVVGGFSSVNRGPLKDVLDKAVGAHHRKTYPRASDTTEIISSEVRFTSPRFFLESDLSRKRIRTEIRVNDIPESLVTDYEDFFKGVSAASGSSRLLDGGRASGRPI